MADDDASATIGATTPIEKNPQREDNATDLSQKKTLDNGGWFTAKYHNSRLIAVPETGTEAVDKSASSQPKLKGIPFAKRSYLHCRRAISKSSLDRRMGSTSVN